MWGLKKSESVQPADVREQMSLLAAHRRDINDREEEGTTMMMMMQKIEETLEIARSSEEGLPRSERDGSESYFDESEADG
jgi:hypothetical protein